VYGNDVELALADVDKYTLQCYIQRRSNTNRHVCGADGCQREKIKNHYFSL